MISILAAGLTVLGVTAAPLALAATGTPNNSANLSPNPILASNLTGYAIQAGGTGLTRISVTDHVAASWAARVTENATTTRVREPRANVTPGTRYTWASDVKAPATSTVEISVSWYDSAGAFLSFTESPGTTGFSQTSWKRASASMVPPAGAAQGETVVNVLSGTKNATVSVTQHQVLPPQGITNLPSQPMADVYADGGAAPASAYAHPGGLVVAGRVNYADQPFKDVSAAGGTELIYLDPLINNAYGRYHDLMLNASTCGAAVPLWPGVQQANSWGSLNDFRVGGVLQGKLHCVLETMVSENPQMGGFFADDLGSRSWFPGIDWSTFPDQQGWRDGAIALAQTFHDVAVEHGLMFVVNGTWGGGTLATDGGGYPDIATHGLSLADGGYIEDHPSSQLPYWTSYATGQWGTATGSASQGKPVMLVGAPDDTTRADWVNAGVFAYVWTTNVQTPWGPFHATGLPSKVAQ